jgi:hypothetical protein
MSKGEDEQSNNAKWHHPLGTILRERFELGPSSIFLRRAIIELQRLTHSVPPDHIPSVQLGKEIAELGQAMLRNWFDGVASKNILYFCYDMVECHLTGNPQVYLTITINLNK